MIKKFAEKFEKVEASVLLTGSYGWEIVEREHLYRKDGILYTAYPSYFSRDQSVQYVTMVPSAEEEAMIVEAEAYAQGVGCIIEKFPYIRLEYENRRINQTVTGDAYINCDTGEIVEAAVPQFFIKSIVTENVAEGFTELVEYITKYKAEAGYDFTIVIQVYPFTDGYSKVISDDELLVGFVCLTKVALVKNPIVTKNEII